MSWVPILIKKCDGDLQFFFTTHPMDNIEFREIQVWYKYLLNIFNIDVTLILERLFEVPNGKKSHTTVFVADIRSLGGIFSYIHPRNLTAGYPKWREMEKVTGPFKRGNFWFPG